MPSSERAATAGAVLVCVIGLLSCRGPTTPGDDDGYVPPRLIDPPPPALGQVLANRDHPMGVTATGGRITTWVDVDAAIATGDTLRFIHLATDAGRKAMYQLTQKTDTGIENPNTPKGLIRTVYTLPQPEPNFARVAVDVVVDRAAIGLDDASHIGRIQKHDGWDVYGFHISDEGQIPIVLDQIFLLYGSPRQGAATSLTPFSEWLQRAFIGRRRATRRGTAAHRGR